MDSSYVKCPTFVIVAGRQPFKLIISQGNTCNLEIWKAAPILTGQLFFFFKEQKIYLKNSSFYDHCIHFTVQLERE